ncbi:MAG: formylglycine-generating enzyme family protein [Planctomycetota bacterium]|nr:formylglycine-generating enzyme family protein [Planctomycetota bacterium]
MKLVYITPGEFMMGSPPTEKDRYENEKLHRVKLTKGYWMAATETTRGQFAAFVLATEYETDTEKLGYSYSLVWYLHPWRWGPEHPALSISWNDARAFCTWLSEKEQRTYRLPTEAEWEYACRAGTTTPYATGETISSNDQANFDGESQGELALREPMPVASFPPNAWGLYDMHGNVFEWCADWWGEYPCGPVTDPTGPKTGTDRVLRGSAWASVAEHCRSAERHAGEPNMIMLALDFRVALDTAE